MTHDIILTLNQRTAQLIMALLLTFVPEVVEDGGG